MSKKRDVWSEIMGSFDDLESTLFETLSGGKEQLESRLADLLAQEQRRCIDWIATGLPTAKIIAGIESFEDAPAPRSPRADKGGG